MAATQALPNMLGNRFDQSGSNKNTFGLASVCTGQPIGNGIGQLTNQNVGFTNGLESSESPSKKMKTEEEDDDDRLIIEEYW